MRVAVYYNNRDVRIEERELPEIGPDELLVKVMASGICGSDVLEWYRVKSAPRVLGHEIAGVVEKAGERVKNWKPGDRVFVSHHVPCNTCFYCLSGNHTVCETLHTTNFDPGGFSEFIRVPTINVDRGVFLLPEEMSFDHGVFMEPVGCVVRAQRLAGLNPLQTVLILGAGFSGLLHLALAKAAGVRTVIVTDVNRFRLELAEKLGASAAVHAGEDVPAAVREHNEGRLADLVVVCTAAYSAFEQALRSVDRGGTIICFATPEPGRDLKVPVNEFWRNSITIMSSYAAAPVDLLAARELLRTGAVPVEELITHRLPLSEAAEGFRLVAEAGDSMKVVLYPFGP